MEPADIQGIEADVVIVADPGAVANNPMWGGAVFDVWDPAVHVAFILPNDVNPAFNTSCSNGCDAGDCPLSDSVLYHYGNMPPQPAEGGALALLGERSDEYSCMLRPQQPNGAPTRHVVFLTPNSTTAFPDGALDQLELQNATFHVACPDCSLDNNFSELEDAAFGSFGGIANLGEPQEVLPLLARAGARRLQCDWPLNPPSGFDLDSDVDVLIQGTEFPGAGDGTELTRVSAEIDCAFDLTVDGPFEWFLDDDRVVLCPGTCAVAHADVFAEVVVAHRFCG